MQDPYQNKSPQLVKKHNAIHGQSNCWCLSTPLANLLFSSDPVRDSQGNEQQHCHFYDIEPSLIYVPMFGDTFTFDPFLTGYTHGP